MVFRIFVSLLGIFAGLTSVLAQDSLTVKMIEKAVETDKFGSLLKNVSYTFPDEQVVLTKKVVNYSFDVNAEQNKLVSTRLEEKNYRTYAGGRWIREAVYESDNYKIDYVRVGKDHKDNQVPLIFADQEIGSIFYHDVKQAMYSFYLGRRKGAYGGYTNTTEKTIFTSKTYTDARYLTNESLVGLCPTIYQEINFTIPKGVELDFKVFNLPEDQFTRSEKNVDGGVKVTYKIYAVNGYEDKTNNPGYRMVYPHILITPHSFQNNGKKVPLFESLDDLYAWYRHLVKEMKQDPSAFEAFVKEVIADKSTDEEKIKAIYYWVQDNIRYVAYEDGIAGFQPKPCEEVYAKRYGDCKGMANLIKQMLVIAGFDARLTWLGTNSIPYNYDVHSLASDNHMICTLIWKGQKYFLDPTEKYAAFGENAERIQGRQVLIEDGDKYIVAEIPKSNVNANKIARTYDLRIKEQQLVGDVELAYSGEGKRIFLQTLNGLKSEHKERALDYIVTKHDGDVYAYDITSTDLGDREQDIKVTGNLEISNKVVSSGKENYVLLNIMTDDLFSGKIDSTRRYGYDFHLKTTYAVTVKIDCKGNTSKSGLPESFTVKNDGFVYNFSFVKKGTSVVLKKEVTLLKPILDATYIPAWNDAISQLDEQLNKALVLY